MFHRLSLTALLMGGAAFAGFVAPSLSGPTEATQAEIDPHARGHAGHHDRHHRAHGADHHARGASRAEHPERGHDGDRKRSCHQR